MRRRAGARILLSLAACVIAAEAVGIASYYIDTGAFFYTHTRTFPELLPTPQDRLVLAEAIHPFFGVTHRPGTPFDIPDALRPPGTAGRLRTNNFGFVAPTDYPIPRTSPDEYFIGLFGGSVGNWFCQLGAERLVSGLRQSAFFKSRKVVTVCLSHEGYKQPQQALVLTYVLTLGQPLDMVINLDGFNEIALGSLNVERGMDASMPSVQHIDPIISTVNISALTPAKLETLSTIFRDREQLLRVRGLMQRTPSAAVHVLLDAYHRRLNNRYAEALGRFNTLPANPSGHSFVEITPPVDRGNSGGVFVEIARLWADSSRVMHATLEQQRVPYFHFLQPNQYFGGRSFTDEERQLALSDASPYRNRVERGYQALVQAGAELRQEGVRFFDATAALDALPEAAYVDDCCHYTLAANRMLADFIVSAILGSPGEWRK